MKIQVRSKSDVLVEESRIIVLMFHLKVMNQRIFNTILQVQLHPTSQLLIRKVV